MQLEIDFNFNLGEGRNTFDNNILHTIRYSLAETLRDCGYGEITNAADGSEINVHAHPLISVFIGEEHHELFISYVFNLNNDEQNGRVSSLLTYGIPKYINNITNNIPDVNLFVRTIYLDV